VREPDRAVLADLGRTTIRLWQWGDPADPPVLLLHGGWDHGRMWDGIAPDIAALGYHVVADDRRGHGDSGRLHSSGSYWMMFMLDVAQVLERLGPPVRIVGHSFGGGLTMSVASAFPWLVERVVNIDGLGPPPEMMLVQDHAAVAAQWLSDAERLWSEPQREYATQAEMAAKRKAINTRLPLAWCEHLVAHGTRVGPGGGFVWKSDPLFRLGTPMPFDEDALLAQYRLIECPVLVVTGNEPDQWNDLPADARRRRLAAIPDARHVTVDGAGHYVHIERPDAVLDLVQEFFAR
jgi:pimeloyl-ACP methyl ester carboxylesterase